MSVFPSRPAAAICLLTGGAALISLAGLVWAQAPNESWPFDDHNPAPPKSAVQQRLEDLYRRDGRPLPDYMQKDGSSGPAGPNDPSQPAADAPGQRNQRGGASSGTVQQQLSDYYQSQGKSVPGAQQPPSGSSWSAARQAAMQRGQANAAPPAQGHWYDRINPFHKSAPAQPQPQPQQVRSQYPATSGMAGRDGNYAAPYVHEASPLTQSQEAVTAPPPAPPASVPSTSPSGPASKSSSFWGDLSLRRVPQQPTSRPAEAPIYVELGQGGKLVRKSAPAPEAPAVTAPAVPVPVVQGAPGTAPIAVVAPAVVALPAVPAAAPIAKKVSPADVVSSGEDPEMPFQASSEAEADQTTESGPYTGLTLEEEQSQLTPPKSESPKTATPPAQHSSQAVASQATKAQPSNAAAPAQQPLAQKLNGAPVVARQSEARADDPPGHVSLPDSGQVSVPDPGHLSLPESDGSQVAGPTMPEPGAPAEHAHPQPNAVAEHPHQRQTTAEKLRLIGERVGMRGLKGFCPVMLRDERELIDANPGYCSIYHGQRYCFSSSEAQARFDASPHKYAPVAGGMDVVVKINSDQAVEGTLDFALWYKDRLYLFCSPESLQAFTISPAAYAMAAQRIQ